MIFIGERTRIKYLHMCYIWRLVKIGTNTQKYPPKVYILLGNWDKSHNYNVRNCSYANPFPLYCRCEQIPQIIDVLTCCCRNKNHLSAQQVSSVVLFPLFSAVSTPLRYGYGQRTDERRQTTLTERGFSQWKTNLLLIVFLAHKFALCKLGATNDTRSGVWKEAVRLLLLLRRRRRRRRSRMHLVGCGGFSMFQQCVGFLVLLDIRFVFFNLTNDTFDL